jgi:hypothetical protein
VELSIIIAKFIPQVFMMKYRLMDSQIMAILKEADCDILISELSRNHFIIAATFFQLHSKYGVLKPRGPTGRKN